MQSNDFEQPSLSRLSLTKHAALLHFELQRIFPSSELETNREILSKLSFIYENLRQSCQLLSPDIITSTLDWINQSRTIEFNHIPTISYVIPVHNCDPDLIVQTAQSLACQIGVDCHSIFVVDGNNPKDQDSIINAINHTEGKIKPSIIIKPYNSGVARARNTGMAAIKTEFFSWLDANDIIHPLRSIHGILRLINSRPNQRINTSYARVNLKQDKIAIRNLRFSFAGHTSFIAYSSILEQYGYLADLPYHEDTEYQQRLEFFRVPMIENPIIDHYLDVSLSDSETARETERQAHLSGDTWQSSHSVNNHPFLEGTYSGELTSERLAFNQAFEEKYETAMAELSQKHFPCIE